MLGDIKLPTNQNNGQPNIVVAVNNLTKKFKVPGGEDKFVVLDSVSVNVEEGKFASIVGPSGCGKSTLLNIIAGIETPALNASPLAGVVGFTPRNDI